MNINPTPLITEGIEVLSFTLGNEEYAIDILKVQEIRGYETVTAIANSPDYLKGVINLRGVIVPIIDMRIKFKIGTPTYNQLTVVVILMIDTQTIGIVVDAVSDVVNLTAEQIKSALSIHSHMAAEYLTGFGMFNDRMLLLVDIEKLISISDIKSISSIQQAA